MRSVACFFDIRRQYISDGDGKKVDSVIMFPIMALINICITVFVGRIVYKEKLTTKNIIGVILGLIAVIVLSVFTPETMSKIFS